MLGLGHLQFGKTFNRRLTLTVLLIAVSQFNFGFDQQGFSTTQAMSYFARRFGKYDIAEDEYYLPTVWLSFFNGFMYLGQAFGKHPLPRGPPWEQNLSETLKYDADKPIRCRCG
jgi:MFS transporter, SP family, sugar:H+ symporter